jgi:hypothetical protein
VAPTHIHVQMFGLSLDEGRAPLAGMRRLVDADSICLARVNDEQSLRAGKLTES